MRLQILAAAGLLAATCAPHAARADECAEALAADKPDPNLDEACLAHHPFLIGTFGVGLGGASASSSGGGAFSYYGTLDIPIGPLRLEVRGRAESASTIDALVGWRISYSYRVADVDWTTSQYIGSTSRTEYDSSAGGLVTKTYDVSRVTGHAAASIVREETVVVAGMHGQFVPGNGLDMGKTFEAGVQWFSTSGFNTHRRVELLGALRGSSPGAIFVWDNAIPPSGHFIGGLEIGYVPYAYGTPQMDDHDLYVMFDLGWGFEL